MGVRPRSSCSGAPGPKGIQAPDGECVTYQRAGPPRI